MSGKSNNDNLADRLKLRSTMMRDKDTVNFQVEKTGRWSARFFQIALSILAWIFLGLLSADHQDIINSFGLWGTINAMWFFALAAPCVAGLLVAIYALPFVFHSWTSRRLVLVEGLCDLGMSIGWIAGFMSVVVNKGSGCPPGFSLGCDRLNWAIATFFFSAVAWIAGLVFDTMSLYGGVCFGSEVDVEMDMEIRRSARHGGR